MSPDALAILVDDASQASAARLGVQRIARRLEFGEVAAGRAAIAASEAVTNIVKHAGGGTFVARALDRGGTLGLEMVAVDAGPGIADFEASAVDGVSSSGTAGTGLGAMRRLCDEFEAWSQPGHGTILRLVVWTRPPTSAPGDYTVGAIVVPKPGETDCGDAWLLAESDEGLAGVVADGLGHGPEASRAAASAVGVLHAHPQAPARRLVEAAHGRLRATRGAAVAALRHERGAGALDFAGVGNIAACIVGDDVRHAMVSHSGIVGHNVHKIVAYPYAWPAGAMVIAHSDGLESQWSLAAGAGLARRHPSIVAAALYRRHWRRRDDVAVLVVRRER